MKTRNVLGRTLYWSFYAPWGELRKMCADGGPVEQRRTEQGRREMELAAGHLPIFEPAEKTKNALPVHLLTGRRFWYQTAFCLWSLARQLRMPLQPFIYDDGSLSPELREPLARLFPRARFVTTEQIRDRLETHLPAARFPRLRERWTHYPNLRKLTDVHLGQTGWKLVLDSDLLFFRTPTVLVDWLGRPDRPLHAVDCQSSYGYSRALLNRLAAAPLAERVNVGLTGLEGNALDWDRLEYWCRELINAEGTNYYLEQALVALLVAGRDCTVTPEAEYVTLPSDPEARACRAVMHHYVAGSKRMYFQHGWKVVSQK